VAITTGGSTEKAYNSTAVPSDTFNFALGAVTNGLLVVTVRTRTLGVPSVSGITWNGDALTQAGTAGGVTTGVIRIQQFYLINPDVGTFDLITTFSADTSTYYIVPTWWNGAAQSSVLGAAVTGSGSTDPSIAVTPTEDNALIVGGYISESNNVLTPDSPQALLQEHDFGNTTAGEGYVIQTSAGLQTMSWAGVDDTWCGIYGWYKAAAAPGGATWPGYTAPFGWR
jgi:hypothetical protein